MCAFVCPLSALRSHLSERGSRPFKHDRRNELNNREMKFGVYGEKESLCE